MLDINLFREEKGNNPDVIRESQRRRFADVAIVDEIIRRDKEWRQRLFELENLRKDFNKINKRVALLRISGEDASEMIPSTNENKKSTAKKEVEVRDAWMAVKSELEVVGNLVHYSVPVSDNEGNQQVKQYAHLLNSTLTAMARTICCILEVPELLRLYMGGKTFQPFKAKPAAATKGNKVQSLDLLLECVNILGTVQGKQKQPVTMFK